MAEIDRIKRKYKKNALDVLLQRNTCFFVSVFSESINGFIKAPFPFSRRSFLCSSSSLHLKHRMEYAVKKYPFSRRGSPRPQVAVEERNGIHPFGMSRKGGVLKL